MSPSAVEIDLTEAFPTLRNAPIVEAAIEVRARAAAPWQAEPVSASLQGALFDYPRVKLLRRTEEKVIVGPGQSPQHEVKDLGWAGLQLSTNDQKQVVLFDRDRFSFSRLSPYESWSRFEAEAMRLWELHVQLAEPSDSQRIGLRFINRFGVPSQRFEVRDYLVTAPAPPTDLPLPVVNFLHRDTLAAPGYPYSINVVRTMQPPSASGGTFQLILDIDVFTRQPSALSKADLRRTLAEMRWLKNRVFFGSITSKARSLFE